MPKTIVRCRTFMCPLGIGRLGQLDACRFHRADDNLPPDGKCPVHGLVLAQVTLPEDCITMTVMGAGDIEDEIANTIPKQRFERRKDERAKRGRAPLMLTELAATGLTEIDAYRADRLLDIAHAVAEARLREYRP